MNTATDILYAGSHLELVCRDTWEYARRVGGAGVVAVVPVFDDGRVLLVEQHRPPVGAPVIEWPAGLVGDGGTPESHAAAAQRELLEETGYHAGQLVELGGGYSSGGLTDEYTVFYLARGLEQRGRGGGVGGERIVAHLILMESLRDWLNEQLAIGKQIDVKVYAGLGMLGLRQGLRNERPGQASQ